MQFAVNLDIFRGPLDLLLYLVRKHELEVAEIPLARVIDQYLEYIAVLEQIDVDAVGDFLEIASLLIEIKSNMVLPGDEVVADERDEHLARVGEIDDARRDVHVVAQQVVSAPLSEIARRNSPLASGEPTRPADNEIGRAHV